MKKLITTTLAAIIMLTIAGCGKQPDVSKLNTQLDQAISAKQYAKAEGINTSIRALSPSKTATSRAAALKAIVSAQAAIDSAKFTTAQRLTAKKTTGDHALQDAIDQLHTQSTTLSKQAATIKNQLKQAESLHTAGDNQKALAVVTALTDTKAIKQGELHTLYIKALNLQIALTQDAQSSATTNDANQSKANTDSSTSSTNNTAASSTADTPEGQPISGSDTITDAQIAQARQDIKGLGEDPTYFSNNDIRRAIIKARAAGRSHIIASDWQ